MTPAAPLCFAALALLAFGCAPAAEQNPAREPAATGEPTGAAAAGPETADAPGHFAGTAWRSLGADGTVYATFLDPGGRYRDRRNGEGWQRGTWTYSGIGAGELCLTPEAEAGVRRCWSPGPMNGETVIVTSAEGDRVELRRIDYAAPEGEDARSS